MDGGGRNRRGIDLGLSVDGGVRSGGSPRRRIGGGGLSSPFNPELEKEIERRRIASVVTLASPISTLMDRFPAIYTLFDLRKGGNPVFSLFLVLNFYGRSMEFLAWVYQKRRNLRIFTFLMCFMGWVSWKIIVPLRKKKVKAPGFVVFD